MIVPVWRGTAYSGGDKRHVVRKYEKQRIAGLTARIAQRPGTLRAIPRSVILQHPATASFILRIENPFHPAAWHDFQWFRSIETQWARKKGIKI
jgi:hypothetical protein